LIVKKTDSATPTFYSDFVNDNEFKHKNDDNGNDKRGSIYSNVL